MKLPLYQATLSNLDLGIVSLYLLAIVILGLTAGRGIRSLRHFAVANRSFGSFIVFATLSASFIGGGFTLGNAGKVYALGIFNIFALWGFGLKEILVACLLAPRMRRFPNAMSVGDIMESAFGTPAKVLTGVFGLFLCLAIVGAQVGAMGVVFSVFLNMNPLLGIFIGCGMLIVYSAFGGIRAVVFTDIVQFTVLVIGMPLVLVFGVIAAGGVGAVAEAVPADHLAVFGNIGWLAFGSLFLTFVLGEALVPPYMQRLMIGDPAKVARGTLYSGLLSFPFLAITGCIGLVALALAPDLENTNQAIPYVVASVVPIGLKGLVVAGIISVVMSSADSFLNSAAVAFCHDIVQPLRKKPLSQKAALLLARIATVVVGLLAIIIAVRIEGLLDILIYAYNFWAPVILIPLIAAFFGMRGSWKILFLAAAAGISANLGWSWLLNSPGGIDGLIVGVAANALVILIASRAGLAK